MDKKHCRLFKNYMKKCFLLIGLSVSCVFLTGQEMASPMNVRLWMDKHFAKGVNPPFSFTYGGKKSETFIRNWQYRSEKLPIDDLQADKYLYTYSDKSTGLMVKCTVTCFNDYPAIEWILHFVNTSPSKNTLLIESAAAIDQSFTANNLGDFVLHRSMGSDVRKDDFRPIEELLQTGKVAEIVQTRGRSSDYSAFPFFNIEMPGKSGIIAAVGWTGSWFANVKAVDEKTVSLKAGMGTMRIVLYPKEEMRTPRISLFFWKQQDRMTSHNQYRQFILAHYSRKINGVVPLAPLCSSFDGDDPEPCGVTECMTEEFCVAMIKRQQQFGILPEVFWLDAGWYSLDIPEEDGTWLHNIGNWSVDKSRYPNGLKPVADAAHAVGAKFMVWFEPERVRPGSEMGRAHPEWLLQIPERESRVFNLGNPDARKWVTDHVTEFMKNEGIDYYRQDCNIDPLPYWNANDAPDRIGMTQIKHIEGLYAFWDSLLIRFPDLLIDNCASGGRRIDIETNMRSSPLLASDYEYTQSEGKQCHNYALNFYLPVHGTIVFAADDYSFRSSLNSTMCLWWEITGKYSEPIPLIQKRIAEFQELRPYFYGDYYPLTPQKDYLRDDSWMAYQMHRPQQHDGIVLAFRRAGCPDDSVHVQLSGLDGEALYELFFEDYGIHIQKQGQELAEGIDLYSPTRKSSLLIRYHKENPFDRLRERYFRILTPVDPDLSDSIVQSRITLADERAKTLWETMNTSPDREYLWESDRYTGFVFGEYPTGTMSSRVTGSFSKLVQLATAYQTNGSQFEKNPGLRKNISEGLDWMLAHRYGSGVEWYDNWWDWVIGSPMTLNNLLTLMYDELSAHQIDKAIEAMNYYAPDVTYEGASTGANKVWQCKNMVLRGIIGHNAEQIRMGIDGLDTEFAYVTTHDGFYRDGSFVQHQWHAYTGGYGRSLLRELVEIVVTVQDSEWEVPENHRNMLFEWIHHAYQPFIYRAALMDMVRGREIARAEQDRAAGHAMLVSLLRLSAKAPESEKNWLQPFIKANILADTWRSFPEDVPTYLLPVAKKIMNDPDIVPAPPRTLNKIFSAMDCAVHIRPGFAFSISMSSSRIESYESINAENIKGWYTGNGMTYLYDNDLRQYSDQFWPTFDAYRPAGTTEDTRPRKAESLPFPEGLLYADGYKSPKDWTGGSSICDAYGMAGMWYAAQDCSLEAKKSWFMVDDEIVALGAGITSSDRRIIETTIENRKLNDGSEYHFLVDGREVLKANSGIASKCRWVHFEGVTEKSAVGYYFPEGATLNLLRETRTGSWFEINELGGSKEPISRSYFTMWYHHSENPVDATYAYVLLPGKSASETGQYVKNPNVAILSNTSQVQAVLNRSQRVTGWNFWEAANQAVAGVRVDAPASVIMKETDGEIIIGIADPTHKAKTITVELNRTVSGISVDNPNIKLISSVPLKMQVNVDGSLGCTHSITFKKT